MKNSNRTTYFTIAIMVIALMGFAYANEIYQPGDVVGTISNVGHSLDEIGLPSCSTGQALVKGASGWECGTASSGGTSMTNAQVAAAAKAYWTNEWACSSSTNGERNPYTGKVCKYTAAGTETTYSSYELSSPWSCSCDQWVDNDNGYELPTYATLPIIRSITGRALQENDQIIQTGTCVSWRCTRSTSASSTLVDANAPVGNYCVLRKGITCPTGYTSSKVHLDLEDSSTHNMGSPGAYITQDSNGNVEIYMCCK